jgi:hypothetical protein
MGGWEIGGDLGLFLRRVVALLLAGGYPLLPFVVGDQGKGYEDEHDDADRDFHDFNRIAWLVAFMVGRI